MNLRGWVKHFLVYGSGVVLMNALPVLLVPIYTHAITPAEYGVMELLNRTQELILVFFSLGLRSTLLTLYQIEEGDTQRQRALYSTAILLLIVLTLMLTAAMILFKEPISHLLFQRGGYAGYVVLILVATYFETLFQIAALYLQSELKSTTYVFTFVARALFSILVNLALVTWLKLGLNGVLSAMLIHTISSTCLLLFYVLRTTGIVFRRDMVWDMLRFGLPLVPASILGVVMNNGDRYFLNAVATQNEVGIYGLGYRLALTSIALVQMPFGKIWSVVMVKIAKEDNGAIHLGRIASYFSMALIFVNVASGLLAPYAIRILATDVYLSAARIVAIVAAAYVLYSWTIVMDASFYITKRTGYKPLILFIGATVTVALYILLIPRYRMMGAAWATLGGYAAFTLATLFYAQRIFFIHYEWSRLARLAIAGLVFYGLGSLLEPFTVSGILLRSACTVGFVGMLCTNLLSRSEERRYLWDQISSWRRRFAGQEELAQVISGGQS
jgi:O-antigen/teichoic acid export membrane protein